MVKKSFGEKVAWWRKEMCEKRIFYNKKTCWWKMCLVKIILNLLDLLDLLDRHSMGIIDTSSNINGENYLCESVLLKVVLNLTYLLPPWTPKKSSEKKKIIKKIYSHVLPMVMNIVETYFSRMSLGAHFFLLEDTEIPFFIISVEMEGHFSLQTKRRALTLPRIKNKPK